jgi:hypothetical protein
MARQVVAYTRLAGLLLMQFRLLPPVQGRIALCVFACAVAEMTEIMLVREGRMMVFMLMLR